MDLMLRKNQSGKFVYVEKVLLQWFNQRRRGWLHKFKLRHGITGKTVSGESGDVDCETMDDWIQNQLPDLLKGYEQKDIFNADETDVSKKLPPLIIGKSKKPRFFKNLKTLPTTLSFFTDWLKGLDDKMRKQKRRIILFIDQCLAHIPNTDLIKNITVKFFPGNCISKLHPLDLGVIKSLKQHYRKLLVKTSIASLDRGDSKNMKIDVLQALKFIMMA
ncbi:Tigger transposable element-derived protein 4 [Araneus ventricosus]|uniref:Tigger transposable element-derived protein 4 n=1 Tax=Araneus ventricosus TaxID=182803 RepID=A0A4Y2ESX2_ARAVE|nr:Tigger transposable element-derived protein 4 [Araneus ventricosus]